MRDPSLVRDLAYLATLTLNLALCYLLFTYSLFFLKRKLRVMITKEKRIKKKEENILKIDKSKKIYKMC